MDIDSLQHWLDENVRDPVISGGINAEYILFYMQSAPSFFTGRGFIFLHFADRCDSVGGLSQHPAAIRKVILFWCHDD